MYRIQIFGASYGAVLAIKLLLAGHRVNIVCTDPEARVIDAEGISVRFPRTKARHAVRLCSRELTGELTATTPHRATPAGYDLVVLAMQEPQFRAPELQDLLARTADARTPCLSIMNMPPWPFLARFPGIDVDDCLPCYTAPAAWRRLDPNLMSHCSADPQAYRVPGSGLNAIEVRLATNFRAARFGRAEHDRMLDELAASVEIASRSSSGNDVDIPVKLRVQKSPFVALSKWPMLIAGNYRCITSDGIRSIETAVHADSEASRRIYDWVCDVCRSLGAAAEDLVPFGKYADAARALQAPSSAARALDAGALHIERVDCLVQRIAARQGMRLAELDAIVERVDTKLAGNRAGGAG